MNIKAADLIETRIFVAVQSGLCDAKEFGEGITAGQKAFEHLEFTFGLEAMDVEVLEYHR